MLEWLQNIDWKFVVGDLVVPIGLFVLGFFTGKAVEHRKYTAKSKTKGDGNIIIQNSSVHK